MNGLFFNSKRRPGSFVLTSCILFLLLSGLNPASAYPRKVLCEFFTNTSCPLCGQWIPPVDRMLEEEYAADSYIYLSWHTWWPGIHDPWYYDNFDRHLPGIDDIITRVTHYGYDQFMGVPSFFFDGTRIRYGNPLNNFLNQIRQQIDRRLDTESPLELTVQTAVAGDNLSAFIQVYSDEDLSGLDLFTALCEVYTHYHAPSGQTEFYGNFIEMLPDSDGITFNIPAHNLRRFDFQNTLAIGWQENPLENLELVVWVQDRNLEVLQAECVRLDYQVPQTLIIDASANEWAGEAVSGLFDGENLPPADVYDRGQEGPFDREDLGDYRVILYHSYINEEAVLTEGEESAFIQYLNEGGALVISSPGLCRNMADSPLFQRYLGTGLENEEIGTDRIRGDSDDPIGLVDEIYLQDEQGQPVYGLPTIYARNGYEPLRYWCQRGPHGPAAVAHIEENYHALTLAFPLEMISGIDASETREAFMARIWRWLFAAQAAPQAAEQPAGYFLLESVYPNPFNAEATVNFTLNRPSAVSLCFQNISGRSLFEVQPGHYSSGRHSLVLNASQGNLAAGVYFLQLQAGGQRQGIKVVYLK